MEELTKDEELRLAYIENMVKVHGMPLVVNKHIMKLMKQKVGEDWCKEYLVEDMPVPPA